MATWEKLTPREKITAVHLDIMRSPDYAILSGIVCMGKVEIGAFPTAGTNGRDCMYGEEFITPMTRKQLRYLVLHENYHKALRHCTSYKDVCKKYPQLSNKAMDYSINQLIEEACPSFIERPTSVPPLIDARFAGMGWLEILKLLLKEEKENPQKQSGSAGDGDGEPQFDEHIPGEADMTPEEMEAVSEQVDEALRQGKILADKLAQKAGNKSGNKAIAGEALERNTNWREHLREFICTICVGDEQSRFCPPNKRMLASGFVMPSHFSEAMGELVIAADTSGSMGSIYPLLFGEIAQIIKTARPDKVRLLWWDSHVCSEQVFTPEQYDNIAKALAPKGGGGTSPGCVVKYMKEKHIEPKALVWLTDGELDGSSQDAGVPALWGVVDHTTFRPTCGRVVHISSFN